jgi:hypothetical protein
MSTYKKEREINHKGAEGAQRRVKTKKSGTLCSFVRFRVPSWFIFFFSYQLI